MAQSAIQNDGVAGDSDHSHIVVVAYVGRISFDLLVIRGHQVPPPDPHVSRVQSVLKPYHIRTRLGGMDQRGIFLYSVRQDAERRASSADQYRNLGVDDECG